MSSAEPPADAPGAPGAARGRPSWPIRSGAVPALADVFSARLETAPGLTAALSAGGVVALVPDLAAPAAFPGPVAAPDTKDWLRSSGKTQLAVAFAESLWQAGRVDLLVWIDATSRASVLSGYAAATAAATGREQASSGESVAAQFLSWLGETTRPWLVVFDDLTGAANLDGLWPAGPAGRVLVTSTDTAAVPSGVPGVPGVRVVPVGPFSLREAIGYLSERLSADPDKRHGAIELARDLDLEPVALAQASAMIANSPLSCREYQARFLRRREHMAQSAGVRPPAAAVTWTFSFEGAEQLAQGGSAQLLLALAALLDGHGIPETVLTDPAAGAFLAGGGGVPASSEGARAALAALEQVGLLTVDPATAPPTVRVNPVLQAAVRAAMPEGMPDQAARSAADALLQAWPEREQPGWPASGLRSCAAALRRITGDLLWDGGCHPLLVRAGASLDRARLTQPAVDHWLDLATTSGRVLGGSHRDTRLVGQRLADAYLAAGRAGEAVPWFQWVLDTLSRRLERDHRDVIGARRRLGHALVAADLPAAITVLKRAVPEFEKVCGPGHPDTLGARDELAGAYLAAGQYSDAITLYRSTLTDRERIQGDRHPQTITTRHGLAGSYLASGRSKDAVATYKRVVADRERVLGPDHLDTLTARNDLGVAYQRTGKTAAAELACEQAWAGFERVLGPRHPDTLRSRAALAQVYSRLGRYGDARVLLRDTVDRLDRILPDGDPLIAELRRSLADIGEE
jgi:tetratricopeptide (TPR) repeat protein